METKDNVKSTDDNTGTCIAKSECNDLLAVAYELITTIEKNVGISKLIDISTGSGMSHLSYSYWKNETRKIIEKT